VRILLIRPGALGDVILTLPAVQALDWHWPDSTIDMMGGPAVLRLMLGRSAVQSVRSFDAQELGPMFQPDAVISHQLVERFASYDVIVNYAGSAVSVFAGNLERIAGERVIYHDPRPDPDPPMHMGAFLQRPLGVLGVGLCSDPPRLSLTTEDRQRASQWWSERDMEDGPAVALHPGSGSPAKNWPAERFAAVARQLVTAGFQVLLLCGPADRVSYGVVQRAMQGMPLTPVMDQPLPLVAALLERCAGYVGNDAGITHLAAAVGVPLVVIFGPTDPAIWAPRGATVKVLRGGVGTETLRAPPYRLEDVTVEQVVDALQKVSSLRAADPSKQS
jgi:heptosyltransferase-2